MKNRYKHNEAKQFVKRYGKSGISPDLSERVYTSRLLGADRGLVLHGGGNTSVKARVDFLDETNLNVIYVKGSGSDLVNIEPEGLPAVRLDDISTLHRLNSLSDEMMVNLVRSALLDSGSPNPSVETLLHAFVPLKYVDHTHSNAVLALSNQKEGNKIIQELFGESLIVVPYVMPGFVLAKLAHKLFEKKPEKKGMLLQHHGIFTFGDTAEEAYVHMIKEVTKAEKYIEKNTAFKSRPVTSVRGDLLKKNLDLGELALMLRSHCGYIDENGEKRQLLLNFRSSKKILRQLELDNIEEIIQRGNITPDHVIRIKRLPLFLKGHADKQSIDLAFARFTKNYDSYFERNQKKARTNKIKLDNLPRLVLVPGFGIFGLGKTESESQIAADLGEVTLETIFNAQEVGEFKSISEIKHFEMEYWSLEQAKLSKNVMRPLTGKITIITGGSGVIGMATAKLFQKQGATVVLFDILNKESSSSASENGLTLYNCDVTKSSDIRRAMDKVVASFGGLDIVISNAGQAWQGRIGEVEENELRKSFEINFFSHQKIAQAAVSRFRKQNNGGTLLFNISKQAVNPGENFGPYGLPKAASLALVRQYALDHGKEGITANAVNADRVRSGLLTEDLIATRARARRVTKTEYMRGNLLEKEVTAHDVAKAFFDLATSKATTGSVSTVDGGNINAALR